MAFFPQGTKDAVRMEQVTVIVLCSAECKREKKEEKLIWPFRCNEVRKKRSRDRDYVSCSFPLKSIL